MAWGTVKVDEQRMRFVVMASRRERSICELCAEFEISRATGHTWLRRYRQGGISEMAERSRRPHHSPTRTASGLEQRVVELRKQRPDWGARKLQVLLAREGSELPVITIHRILVRHELLRAQDRHRAAVRRFERGRCNQLWQMDFKGTLPGQTAPVGPLSVLDDHSRYAVALEQTGSTRAEGVKACVEAAFDRCGVPEEMLMDHGTPWWNMKAASGATWLTVWLMKQGIALHWSGYRHPQTQGKVERFHGTLEAAMRRRGGSGQDGQKWLDEFRNEYNHERPHEALGMKTPAAVWQRSQKNYQAQPKRWEYAEGAEVRKVCGQGQLTVEGRRWEISRALADEWVELVRIDQRILVYYCRSLVRELDPLHQRSTAVDRWWHSNSPNCKGSPDNNL
jgi:transposase InsO family protein